MRSPLLLSLRVATLALLFALPPGIFYRSVSAGAVLGFAREFGTTLLIAEGIPGETETLPLALYAAIERGDDAEAGDLALLGVAVSFALLLVANRFAGRVAAARGDASP